VLMKLPLRADAAEADRPRSPDPSDEAHPETAGSS